MEILKVGGCVSFLRFLPDSRLLAVSTSPSDGPVIEILSHLSPDRLRIPLQSGLLARADANSIAIAPDGKSILVAWLGRLMCLATDDGADLPIAEPARAHQVVLSRDGNRRLTTDGTSIQALDSATGTITMRSHDAPQPVSIIGFLHHAETYACADVNRVRLHSFASHEELASTRYPANRLTHPLVSFDARRFGMIGYTSMYVFDTESLDKPHKISAKSSFGDFRSFAFHPHLPLLAVRRD